MLNIKQIKKDTIVINQEISHTREDVEYEVQHLTARIKCLHDRLVYFQSLQQAFRDADKQEK